MVVADICVYLHPGPSYDIPIPELGYEISQGIGPISINILFGAFISFGADVTVNLCVAARALALDPDPFIMLKVQAVADVDLAIVRGGASVVAQVCQITILPEVKLLLTSPTRVCANLDMSVLPFSAYSEVHWQVRNSAQHSKTTAVNV